MKLINGLIDRLTERMLIMFTVGLLAGALVVILQSVISHLNIPRFTFKTSGTQPPIVSIFEQIKPKLSVITNAYALTANDLSTPLTSAAEAGAASYMLVDFDTGVVLSEKNSQKAMPIASLTKIMTAVVTLDLVEPDTKFSVSEKAAQEIPTKIGVVAGQKMRVEELLQALLMTSANDAAAVLQEGVDQLYGSPIFIRAMNEKAKVLDLNESRFDNPQGFDSASNYSSAEDLTILSHYALTNYPLIAEIAKKDYVSISENRDHKQFDLYNWNGLIGVYPNTTGFKIGNTDAAGKTTVVLSEREGKRILAVLLGAPDVLKRDMWAAELLDLGYAQTKDLEPIAVTEEQLKAKYATWK